MRFEHLTGGKRLIFFGTGGLVFGAIAGTLVANLYVAFATGSDVLHADLTSLLAL